MKRNMLNGALCLALAVFYLTSCKKQAGSHSPSPTKSACSSCQVEEAFPHVTGKEIVFHYGGEDMTVVQKGDKYIMGGDIILTPAQIALLQGGGPAGGRTAVNSITKLWPNRTVYYAVDPSLPDAWRVTDAIAHWQSVTNLVFVPRSTESNYIYFFSDAGCYSSVGMTGGQQFISLDNGCSTGNAIHEIGHAIGFYHEQMRSDRDNAITINFGNIISGYENQFKTYTALSWGGLQLNGFDFNSIMLYGSYAFSKNGLPTIVKRGDNSTFEGQRAGLSAGDIDTYNYLYNRPYLALVNQNTQIINTPQQRGRTWDVYVKAYTDASRTTPMSLQRNLEVHYAVSYQDQNMSTSTRGYFVFHQGANSYYLGQGESLINLVGTKYTISQDYGLVDLIQ